MATPIAVIGPAGADYQTILTGNPDKLTVSAPAETTPLSEETRSFSSPRARMRARELGVDYHTITGSGPMGMIIERDVLGAVTQSNTATAATIPTPDTSVTPVRGEHQIPVTNMRRIIAQRMVDSLNTLAQANHRLTVDMTEAVRLREQLKAADVKISYNDIVIRCTAKALIEFPMMNATMDDSFITTKDYVNIGMAVATDTGLLRFLPSAMIWQPALRRTACPRTKCPAALLPSAIWVCLTSRVSLPSSTSLRWVSWL